MIHDFKTIQQTFAKAKANMELIRSYTKRPLTLTEKILFTHLDKAELIHVDTIQRGKDYCNFYPDRVAMQDATAQMALLQFMNAGKKRVAVPSSVHCDHLIIAEQGEHSDLVTANNTNAEVYNFLSSVSQKYGIGFWKPGSGIIHQIILENYAYPGGMIIGTDSHTVNGGGLGMISIGVGGADACDVMSGMAWELKMPKIIGVKLTGTCNPWVAPKDIILKLAGILTVKGATNAVLEYFGEGTASLSCTGKATICNMGAEVGATTSIFAYDASMKQYLEHTGRAAVAQLVEQHASLVKADDQVIENPELYYDSIIEINLTELEPHINGPFTPDLATPISKFGELARAEKWPLELKVGLIGSCTNSSYEDLTKAASLARQALDLDLEIKSEFLVSPGSVMIKKTAKRDGLITDFENIGGVVLANACGPCIGQWNRENPEPEQKNSIITSFNRNFAKRADGNPNTYSFVASPEIVTALTIAGRIDFNPLTESLINKHGKHVTLQAPVGDVIPAKGFEMVDAGFIAPDQANSLIEISISPDSERLQKLEPFEPWNGKDFTNLQLLIKAQGKCTTDHISMAGPWLRYRGHLENISDNLLMGAVNAYNGETNKVCNSLTGLYDKVSSVAKAYKTQGLSSIVVAEDNYGEGSSREHAAMEPRFLGVQVILAKSFARIHETNLKKQGMLALTFVNPSDYDLILEGDTISIIGLESFTEGVNLQVKVNHTNGTTQIFEAKHTYNNIQIEWFKAGSALNLIAKESKH
ncbi:MAG TPA: aconitate hydratase [Bacteroidales bacterium]|nr:aconitate hydratase [Bacteroidales bacterium]